MDKGATLKRKWIEQLPNQLTILRIILTPVFLLCLFSEGFVPKVLAAAIFLVASATDAYDGYIARKYQVVSSWGKFLDPLADKILVLSAFAGIWYMGLFPLWMLLLIVLRDVSITGLRMFMRSRQTSLETSYFAKSKTAVQMVAIYLILTFFIVREWSVFSGVHGQLLSIEAHGGIWILILLVTLLTVASGLHYFYVNRSTIRRLLLSDS
ncbi:MAG TPA: CDP-diacylglycerol--glycerol-3-phosphate 3-phosphatidyltransferase [bacterium]|nr:CDP-diacylglycerol--glycerol-3-phosphate 3-phosphatidyltransferase [bacterium]